MLFQESLRLAYMAFFKPFKLNEELSEASRYLAPNVSVWRVWSELSSSERRVVLQAFIAVCLGAIVWPTLAAVGAFWLGYPFWSDSLRGISILLVVLASFMVGVGGILLVGVSFGVNMGGAVSLAGSLAAVTCIEPMLALVRKAGIGQVIGLPAFGLGSGFTLGLILGLAAIATFTLRPSAWWFGGVCGVGGGLALGILFTGVVGGSVIWIVSVILVVFFVLGFLAGYYLGYRRFLFYPVEVIWQVVLTALSSLARRVNDSGQMIHRLYLLSPVCKDELIWFRLWTLDRQLAWLALSGRREFALETILKIARSFHQWWAAEAALAAIVAHDLRECTRIPDIAEAASCLRWFPRAIDLPSLALQRTVTHLNEVSQGVEAATRALDGPGWRINLRKAHNSLEALQGTLVQADRRVHAFLMPIAQCWKAAVEQALEGVPEDAGPMLLENCYLFGSPIPPAKERMFVGREDLFTKIQQNLSATHKPTLVLHGQRRTGKTSLLLQLGNRLPPDYVPIYVDLQKTAPVDGLNRFLYTLAREAVRQSDAKRRIALPPVELEDFDRRGTHAFFEWLEQSHLRLDERLLLFTLDEFEKIEEAIESDRIEEAVLDVLRHLIQHHSSWFVLLFAGVRTLEEMSRNWHSYFINVRPLQVSYLDREAARKLILLPAKHYPIDYDSQVVETILEATRAHPFLVQAVCFELIQYLNSQGRRVRGPFGRVIVADAREAIRQAQGSAQLYFHDLWETSADQERLVLAEVAHHREEWAQVDDLGTSVGAEQRAIHEVVERLKQRGLIERRGLKCRFQVPMVRQWIRYEKSLDDVRIASQPLPEAVHRHNQE